MGHYLNWLVQRFRKLKIPDQQYYLWTSSRFCGTLSEWLKKLRNCALPDFDDDRMLEAKSSEGGISREEVMQRSLLWGEIRDLVSRHRLCIIGFSCCLAWLYTAMFSCALVPQDYALFSSDTFWSVSALAEACMAAFVFVRFRWRMVPSAFVVACSLLTALGTIVIRFGFYDSDRYVLFYCIGAVLAGLGFAVLVIAWNGRLSALVEEGIEIVVPSAFALSFVIYFALFALKGSVAVYPIAALPVVSAYILVRARKGAESQDAVESAKSIGAAGHADASSRGIKLGAAKVAVLFFVAWFSFGFFRIFAAPDFVSDRTLYYLVPFSVALITAFCILIFNMKHAHVLSISSAFRWVFALACLGYAVIYIDVRNDALKLAGYAFNFTCMFSVQICTFIVFPKLARKTGLPIQGIISGLLVAEGVGIFAGVWVAKEVYVLSGGAIPPAWCFFVLAVLVAAGMVVGFSPEKRLDLPLKQAFDDGSAATACQRKRDVRPHKTIDTLGERYGFSPRECEIGSLLLGGYSRPRIRDELYISLNTVNAHVKSIYTKAGVHSMQEFLLLARHVELGEGEMAERDFEEREAGKSETENQR